MIIATIFFLRCSVPMWAMASSFLRFPDHAHQCFTVCRIPLDEWSAHCTDLYLKTHSTHHIQTSMPLVGFEPIISAGEEPQTNALDHVAPGINYHCFNAPWKCTPLLIHDSPHLCLAVCYDTAGSIWNDVEQGCEELVLTKFSQSGVLFVLLTVILCSVLICLYLTESSLYQNVWETWICIFLCNPYEKMWNTISIEK
jgi:hypothetical protein